MSGTVFAKGNTALISGAASGVGLAVAHLCRKHGMKLALLDNNKDHLAKAKQAIGTSETTETYDIDVSKIDQWHAVRDKVKTTFPRIDLLMLNAGTQMKGGWENTAYFHKILDTNLFGIIYGLNTFIPVIQAQQSATPSSIVITGSKQGITNPPGNPAYNASKAAVKALAEHLSFDMRGSNTSVHMLVPGWTFTGLSGGGPTPSREKPQGAWAPEQVADFMYKKMAEDQFWIICPDNDVSEDTDRRRMLWTAGDAVHGRKPLSRWREEYAEESKKTMAEFKI